MAYNPPMNIGQSGSPVRANGGGGHQAIGYRDVLDARRSVGDGARTPSAEYPDGYLGTINNRRGDRLLANLQGRLTQRSYQRGVHKGERIDPGDYVWGADFNPMSGLKAEAAGRRWAPSGNPTERLAHMGKNAALSPSEMLAAQQQYGVTSDDRSQNINAARKAQMQQFLPKWR